MTHTLLLEDLRKLLTISWSIKTSSLWLQDNPARGQCSVTALVVQDILGGGVLKTRTDGGWHFYNLIDGQRLDLTDSQFVEPLHYEDRKASRDEAFADTSPEQYELLRATVLRQRER